MHHYFSSDYSSARRTFLDAAYESGAVVDSYRNGCSDDVELFTDSAVIGPANAEYAMVLMSGVHGVEGFAGSAIQSGLLKEQVAGCLPESTKLVMVHAVNPYGFAFIRRFNEDNVDINRNFVSHEAPYPENPGYEALADIALPSSLSPTARLMSVINIAWLRLTQGTEKLQQALTYGQYSHPEGLFFGGNKPAWSNKTLHEIVRKTLSGAGKAIVIDFHTGLGPYGVGEIIMNDPVEDPAYKRACSWWGDERVKSTVSGESVSAHLCGTVKSAFDSMLPSAEVTGVGLEFGTLPAIDVFMAMRAENWLHHRGGESYRDADRVRKAFRDAFCPDDDFWRTRVWEQGRDIVKQTLEVIKNDLQGSCS